MLRYFTVDPSSAKASFCRRLLLSFSKCREGPTILPLPPPVHITYRLVLAVWRNDELMATAAQIAKYEGIIRYIIQPIQQQQQQQWEPHNHRIWHEILIRFTRTNAAAAVRNLVRNQFHFWLLARGSFEIKASRATNRTVYGRQLGRTKERKEEKLANFYLPQDRERDTRRNKMWPN